MAKNMGQINFGVGFQVNKASLNEVKKSIQELRNMTEKQINEAGGRILEISPMAMASNKNHLHEMRKELDALDKAMEAAFNPKLGTYELNKFNEALKASGTSAQRVFETVSAYGNTGSAALLNMTTQMLATDRAAKQVHSTFQKLGETMMNTIRWSITSTAINTVTGAIQQAYHYALDLDESLNDIMIVTDKSAEEMDRFARSANKAAKGLGASTKDYTGASLIYYQQGLSDQEVKARTDTTLKAAAVTGQSASAVSEQLTAVWNGYKVSAEESELYIDKLAAVAASTAADLEELSTGMSKVASAANVMGVDVDQLNAQLATIVSVTREAPESVGTALKTVYARMSDIEAGLDTETTLGEYTTQMAEMGINVLDAKGNLRDMGDVVEEIGGKWNTLNREQQVSLAQSIAGTRQYSRMMALFDNWDMYQDALTTSLESAGALSSQHSTYLEGIAAHQEKLRASAEGLYDSIFESDDINAVYDGLAKIVTLVDKLVQSMGGMPGILATVGMLFAKAAKSSIADLISKQKENKLNQTIYKNQITNGLATIRQLQQEQAIRNGNNEALKTTLALEEEIYSRANNLTDNQWNSLQAGVREYNALINETISLEKDRVSLEDKTSKYWQEPGRVTRNKGGNRKTTTVSINGIQKSYYLADIDDKSPDGKATVGLRSAKEDRETLKKQLKTEIQLNGTKTKKVAILRQELVALNKVIIEAEKENRVKAESEQRDQDLIKSIQTKEKAAKAYAEALKETARAQDFANKVADVVDSLTTIAFTATSVSSSVTQLWTDIQSGENTLASVSMQLLAIGGGLTSTLAAGIQGIAQAKAAKAAAEAAGNAAAAGAAKWSLYWSAATMGISLVITGLSTIFSVLSANNKAAEQAAKDEVDRKIEEAEANLAVAEAHQKLTQSYLNAYAEYEKTGNEKEKLLDLAQQLAEAYKDEELHNLALAGSYDVLAESIRNKRLIESQEKSKDAQDKKTEAEKGIANSTLTKAGISFVEDLEYYAFQEGPGGAFGEWVRGDESNNANILANTSQFVEIDDKKLAKLTRDPSTMTTAEKIQFYHELIEARKLMTPEVEGNQSEIYATVDKIITEWEPYIKKYEEAEAIMNEESIKQKVYTANISNTSFKDFTKTRESIIENALESQGLVKGTEAWNSAWSSTAYSVDKIFSEMEGNASQLVKRYQWLQGQKTAGKLSDSAISVLQDEFDISNFGETEFNALSFIDVEQYKNDAKGLLEAARKKAKELRDQYMLDAKDEILQSSNQRIQDLEKDIAKATGEEKLDLIQAQNKELENQIKLLEKIRDTSAAANKVSAQTDFKNLAVKYNFNTDSIQVGKDQEWDVFAIGEAIEADNNLSDDQKDNLLKLLFRDVLQSQNKYSTLNEDIQDLTENLDENNIEEFEIKLNTKIDLNNLQKEYTDFVRSFAKENDYTELIKFDLQDFSTSLQSIEDYKARISELQGRTDLDDAYKEAQIRKLINNIMAEGTNLLEKRNSLEQSYLSYNDAVNESYEQYLSLIESANGLLEHQVELNELIYGDKAFKNMQDYYIKQVTNNQLIVTANNERYQTDKADYEALLKEGLSVDDPKVKAARDRYLESGEAYAASLAAQAQGYADQYSNTLENILDNFTKDMLDEDAMKEWDWIQSTSDMFVDEIEEAYEKSKLQKAFSKAINESQSLKAQQALNKAHQEELKMLEKKDKLTQYDLERAQKRLDIEIARLALEEARDSKTQMRLMRQADGSYGYQYVADQSAIEEKQTQYETALKARYDSDQNELSSQMSKSQQLIENFKSEISELNPASETYENDLQAIIDKYKPLLKAQGSNVSRVLENLRLSSAEMSSLYGTEVVTPELSSSAVQQIVNWGSDDGAMLDALMKELVTGQESAKSGIGAARDTLDSLVSSMYTSIVGSGANDEQSLLGAQNKQIDALNDMSSAMLGVVTTIGLLDDAIKMAKGDVDTSLASAYDIVLKDGKIEMTPKAFDTGGYTGAWGPDGRLATLHEKELVLNKYDTANILSAVDIVRSLGNSMLKTVSGMGRGYDLSMAAWELAKDFIIEQTVNINAEFPNAADRSEIEAAFEELMLLATQHAFEDVRGR